MSDTVLTTLHECSDYHFKSPKNMFIFLVPSFPYLLKKMKEGKRNKAIEYLKEKPTLENNPLNYSEETFRKLLGILNIWQKTPTF